MYHYVILIVIVIVYFCVGVTKEFLIQYIFLRKSQ